MLNEIFAGRVYVTWKSGHWDRNVRICSPEKQSKWSSGHAHGSSELPDHCCWGVLLPQALLTSFAFLGPNHGNCHLMGCALTLGGLVQSCSQVRDPVSVSAPALVV